MLQFTQYNLLNTAKCNIYKRGVCFETKTYHFANIPGSRLHGLSILKKADISYDRFKDEYYFDRNGALFPYILDYIHTAHVPNMEFSKMVDPIWLPPWQKTMWHTRMACRLSNGWSVQVPVTFAHLLEKCVDSCVQQIRFIGQNDIWTCTWNLLCSMHSMLGGLYSGSCKSQGDFMRQLKEIAKECSFTKFVKFLFLTHSQNSRVRDALLDRMKATNTPAQCLAIAKTVEITIETEKLSKSFLLNINKPESTEVDAVSKKKGFKGPGCKQSRGQQQHSHSRSMTKCRNCGSAHPPKKCPAYGKECFSCKKRGHFKQFC